MLQRVFDPTKPHRFVRYLRMSSDLQNPRSPEQQIDMIAHTLRRTGHCWQHVADYIDRAVSGRLVAKRPDLQRMLRDIRTGVVAVDLILVDTFERFGRADEIAMLRQELFRHYGVLVLTADTQFADPTSPAGRALSAIESLRATTDDNRLKAHVVLRGKRDAASRGHWPGGAPPFGYRLKSALVERNGRTEVDFCTLEPDPATRWIIAEVFATALARGWGCTRLARHLNDHPDVPPEIKPVFDQTVNYWLSNPIYVGELVWGKHSTDVIDDVRVIERNPEGEVLRVPDFCEPLVAREVWDKVQAIRNVRGERARLARQRSGTAGKQIAPLAPGLTLKYLLTGLVRCGHCGRSMIPSSSGIYTTKDGTAKRYVSYVCPGYPSRACPNGQRIPEDWLRQKVCDLIRQRLFPRHRR